MRQFFCQPGELEYIIKHLFRLFHFVTLGMVVFTGVLCFLDQEAKLSIVQKVFERFLLFSDFYNFTSLGASVISLTYSNQNKVPMYQNWHMLQLFLIFPASLLVKPKLFTLKDLCIIRQKKTLDSYILQILARIISVAFRLCLILPHCSENLLL